MAQQSRPGRLAQLARAPRLHRGGRGFEPLSAHHENNPVLRGRVIFMVECLAGLEPPAEDATTEPESNTAQ